MDRLTRFAWLTLGWNLVVILWGAFVRATGAGAGCGNNWPLCNGEIVPRAPEIKTVIEFSHRLSSGLALVLVVTLLVWTLRARPAGHPARLGAMLSFALILSEAAVGAGLVFFDMVADNVSLARAAWVAGHLVNTFLLVAALALTAHWQGGGARLAFVERRPLGRWVALALGATLLLSMSGAVAALGNTLFPGGEVPAGMSGASAAVAEVLLHLSVIHPLLAGTVGLYLLYLASHPVLARGPSRGQALWLAGLTLLQMGAGVVNILLRAPVWLQLTHLLFADLAWVALVLLAARVWAAPETAPPRALRAGPAAA
jgi:heme A synthase